MQREGIPSITAWAEHHRLARPTLYALLRGRPSRSGKWIKPSLDFLKSFSEAVEIPLHDILYVLEPDAFGVHHRSRILQTRPCNTGDAPHTPILALSTLHLDPAFSRNRKLAAFQVQGTSMAAGQHPVHSGGLIAVDLTSSPQNGALVVAQIQSGEFVCRLWQDGHLLTTHPAGTLPGRAVLTPDVLLGNVLQITNLM